MTRAESSTLQCAPLPWYGGAASRDAVERGSEVSFCPVRFDFIMRAVSVNERASGPVRCGRRGGRVEDGLHCRLLTHSLAQPWLVWEAVGE